MVGGTNCFGCHASYLNGEFVIGLGNAFSDFTNDWALQSEVTLGMIQREFNKDSKEWEAFWRISLSAIIDSPHIKTPFKGGNAAFALKEATVSHRPKKTLEWSDEPVFELPPREIASDVPPWWHVSKKNVLYYNGLGGGDWAKSVIFSGKKFGSI